MGLGIGHDVESGVWFNVLVEGAAAMHVDDLQAATDAENGCTPRRRRIHQCQLEVITSNLGRKHVGLGLVAVASGVDVGTTAEKDSIAAGNRVGGVEVEGKVHRESTGFDDSSGVVAVEELNLDVVQRLGLTDDLGAKLAATTQADEGSTGHGV